jgi:hypothetical protein
MTDDQEEPAGDSGSAGSARECPWCSTPAAPDATTCGSCGAALAQRDDLGGIVIPGLTGVDPALKAYDAQPMHLRGPSPSQGLATGILPAVAMGGPAGLAIIGGIAAVAAVEYLGAGKGGGGQVDPESVGKPSELAMLALEKAQRGADANDPEPSKPLLEDDRGEAAPEGFWDVNRG